jgi:hypothetical protein
MKLFISYSHEDKQVAYDIERICEQFGIGCFRDEKNISWGASINDSVRQGLRDCSHLVVVVSPASVTSPWVAYEVGRAHHGGLTVLPFVTHPSLDPPAFLRDALKVSSIDDLRRQMQILSQSVDGVVEDLVQKLGRIPAALKDLRISDAAKRAFDPSVGVILREFQRDLDELERGKLIVRGPEMDDVFGHFVDAVSTGFKSLSRDDLDYWASDESSQYLALNKRLIDQGSTVERVFLLPRALVVTRRHQDALRRQVEMGISVRVAYLESCGRIVADDSELDFGLFESFAVSFWRFSVGRVFKVSTSAADYQAYDRIYRRVLNICVEVPGKTGARRKVFDDVQELDRWVEQHRRDAQGRQPRKST